jgi:hypothetical protein
LRETRLVKQQAGFQLLQQFGVDFLAPEEQSAQSLHEVIAGAAQPVSQALEKTTAFPGHGRGFRRLFVGPG